MRSNRDWERDADRNFENPRWKMVLKTGEYCELLRIMGLHQNILRYWNPEVSSIPKSWYSKIEFWDEKFEKDATKLTKNLGLFPGNPRISESRDALNTELPGWQNRGIEKSLKSFLNCREFSKILWPSWEYCCILRSRHQSKPEILQLKWCLGTINFRKMLSN